MRLQSTAIGLLSSKSPNYETQTSILVCTVIFFCRHKILPDFRKEATIMSLIRSVEGRNQLVTSQHKTTKVRNVTKIANQSWAA